MEINREISYDKKVIKKYRGFLGITSNDPLGYLWFGWFSWFIWFKQFLK
jgi:hypothetical protein